VHDLFDRAAVGAAVLEDLRRPAIQPVSQFLDGLHVARFAARDMHSCDFAQFFFMSSQQQFYLIFHAPPERLTRSEGTIDKL